jgi:hypothetical protein
VKGQPEKEIELKLVLRRREKLASVAAMGLEELAMLIGAVVLLPLIETEVRCLGL